MENMRTLKESNGSCMESCGILLRVNQQLWTVQRFHWYGSNKRQKDNLRNQESYEQQNNPQNL